MQTQVSFNERGDFIQHVKEMLLTVPHVCDLSMPYLTVSFGFDLFQPNPNDKRMDFGHPVDIVNATSRQEISPDY
jgi:hypothetical protein